jgi:anaerobic magnesium-protoporphyrin IX monomethyl ester cyclase
MKVALVRTPRHVWPFNSESSAFWPPLGFLSLAGGLAACHPDWSITITDCPGSRIGWRTLAATLERDRPDVLCLGEETVSSHEALRLARLVKEQRPQTIVVAGGVFFSHAAEEVLASGTIDYIVHGEGEITLPDLLDTVAGGGDPAGVRGISYRQDGQIATTAPRPLLEDMDALPWPAWLKVPMSLYGRGSRNHPGLISVEHGRGCLDRCDFCILWKHMGRTAEDGRTVRPCYRTKSAARSFEEAARLVREFDRYTFGWVDPTWNADPQWTDEFCGLVLKHGLRIQQTAWVRADGIVRDEGLGVLEKAVRAGLCQVMIGVERPEEEGLQALGKHANGPDTTARAFEILRTKYPDVLTIGSVIFGLWDETRKSIDHLARWPYKVGMDYCFFIPLTPNPGTRVHEEAVERGIVAVADRRAYNFHTPVLRTRRFSPKQLERLYFRLLFSVSRDRLRAWVRRFFTVPAGRRRRVLRSLLQQGTRIALRYTATMVRHPGRRDPTVYSRKPGWYDS